ncbi:MAG: hypothetical protein MUC65_05505 [Pontiellaceae bacterium]|jgi:hypothetical protein|nr:hypothetical protein [Pontiellaceae bacterium]
MNCGANKSIFQLLEGFLCFSQRMKRATNREQGIAAPLFWRMDEILERPAACPQKPFMLNCRLVFKEECYEIYSELAERIGGF